MNDAIGHWIAGFAAGEGCFALHANALAIRFCVKLRADDRAVLELMQEHFGVGRVTTPRVYRGTKMQCEFAVSKIKDLALVIVPFFERYRLRGRKERDFKTWASAVRLMFEVHKRPLRPSGKPRGRSRWTKTDHAKLERLTLSLKRGRQYRAAAWPS